MTSTAPVSTLGVINGDLTATQKVNGATVDNNYALLKTTLNDLIESTGVTLRDDNTIRDSHVRLRMLHSEVLNSLGSGNTVNVYTGTVVQGDGYDPMDVEYGAVGTGVSTTLSAAEAAEFTSLFAPFPAVAVAGDQRDWAAWQLAVYRAILSKEFLRPSPGIYLINKRIDFGTYAAYNNEHVPSVIGQGVTINQTTASEWCFWFSAQCGGSVLFADYGGKFEGIKFNAKYGITFNTEMDTGVIFGGEGNGHVYSLGWKISNCEIAGTYGTLVDANYGSYTLEPTRAELEGYGVGIRMAKCFNFVVSGCWIYGLGIGIELGGSDICTIIDSRFQSNARHVHNEKVNNFGSQLKITLCDILQNHRTYGVFNKNVHAFISSFNFFENAQFPNVYIKEEGTIGSNYIANRWNYMTTTLVRWASLDPDSGLNFANNFWLSNLTAPWCEVLNNYWTVSRPYLASFDDPSGRTPLPDHPAIFLKPRDPYLFSYYNFAPISGSVALAFPWEKVDTRWVIKYNAGTLTVFLKVPQLYGPYFTLSVTARVRAAASVPTGGIDLLWRFTGDVSDTTVYNAGLLFSDKVNYETKKYIMASPASAGKPGSGTFTVAITVDTLELAEFSISPFFDNGGSRYNLTLNKSVSRPMRICDNLVPDPSSDPTIMYEIGPVGGNVHKNVSRVIPTVPMVSYWHIPVYASVGFYNGYVGGNGGGMMYSASDPSQVYFGAVSHYNFGTWDLDPTVNVGAVWTNRYRLEASGRMQIGPNSIASPDAVSSLQMDGPLNCSNVKRGSAAPNTIVTGTLGDLYLCTSGGAGVTLWVKESGINTNTGWVGK